MAEKVLRSGRFSLVFVPEPETVSVSNFINGAHKFVARRLNIRIQDGEMDGWTDKRKFRIDWYNERCYIHSYKLLPQVRQGMRNILINLLLRSTHSVINRRFYYNTSYSKVISQWSFLAGLSLRIYTHHFSQHHFLIELYKKMAYCF